MHTFKRCVEQGWTCDWADRGERSVYLTAKWAGLGGMPIGFSYACEAINSNEQVSTHIDLKLYAMADLDSTCQGNDYSFGRFACCSFYKSVFSFFNLKAYSKIFLAVTCLEISSMGSTGSF